jgi:hypothetical protein
MNTSEQAEFENLLHSLDPVDLAQARQFLHILKISHLAHYPPPSAQEWARLTEWQRKKLYYRVVFYVNKRRVMDYIRSLLPH